VYANGVSGGTITAVNSTTSLTVSTSQTVTSNSFSAHSYGLEVTAAGNVGIGTALPSATLDMRASTANVNLTSTTGTNIAYQTFNNTGGELIIGVERSTGGGLFTGSLAYSSIIGTGNAKPIHLATNNVVRTTIDSLGNVGIGTISPQTALQVAGIISPSADNTNTLGSATYRFTTVYATNGTINTSDRREKKDIYDSDLGLNFINKLRPVSYRWNTGIDDDVHYGLIAQEAEQVIAEIGKSEKTSIVSHDETTDRYGVRYSELISPIIKSVQELYSRMIRTDREIASINSSANVAESKISKLEMENEKLKQENKQIKQRLDQIEKALKSK
jgi:trimeric autotransporter adhesin